ncbi:MAG: hypothetical protein ACLRMW_06270 [[Clostridium] symbiosum]
MPRQCPSILRRDFDTAGSVMFLLGIEILRKSGPINGGDLARSMSLNITRCGRMWTAPDSRSFRDREGDCVTVHMGNVIPLDGIVAFGTPWSTRRQ